MWRAERGQSEVIGNVLLVGVVVIVVTTAGAGIIFNFTGGNTASQQTALLDVQTSATATNLSLSHNGGDSVAASDLLVIVSNETTEKRYSVDSANLTGTDNRFDPGETFERPHGLAGRYLNIVVIVQGQQKSEIVRDTTERAPEPTTPESRNSQPSAAFTSTPTSPTTGQSVTFDGSSSSDSDGSITSYEWDWTSDGTFEKSGSSASHTYSSPGEYDVTLRVTDDDGATNSTTQTVTVTNAAPTASFTQSCTGTDCSFDASGSSDTDGNIASYDWDWTNDGTFDDSGQTATHEYPSEGTYDVTLRVTDDDGVTAETTEQVTVQRYLFASIDATDLVEGNSADQTFTVELNSTLASTDTLSIDVSDTGTDVEYPTNTDKYYPDLSGDISLTADPVGTIEFTPDSDVQSGETITIDVSNIKAKDAAHQKYTVTFSSGGTSEQTTFVVRDDNFKFKNDYDDGDNIYVTGDVTIPQDEVVDGEVDAGGSVTLKSNATVTGAITAGDDVTIKSGSESGAVDADGTVTLKDSATAGEITSESDVTTGEDSIVDDITATDSVELNQNSTAGTITSDSSITLNGDSESDAIDAGGDVTLEDEAIAGAVKSDGAVTIKQDTIADDITASGAVNLKENATAGTITTDSSVTLKGDTETDGVTADGDVTADSTDTILIDGDIDVTGGDSQDVILKDDTTVTGDVFVEDGSNLDCKSNITINGQDCEDYKDDNY